MYDTGFSFKVDGALEKFILAHTLCKSMRHHGLTVYGAKVYLGKGLLEIYKILEGKYSPMTEGEINYLISKLDEWIDGKITTVFQASPHKAQPSSSIPFFPDAA